MELWAGTDSFGESVCFLMVSLQGPGLARAFSERYRLSKVTNSFIEKDWEMPNWGQLGCQGFIIFDEAGKVVVRRSERLVEVGELAFRDVEFQLKNLLSNKKLLLQTGEQVRIVRLETHQSVNGRVGQVKGFDEKQSRYLILLEGQRKPHRVKPTNLLPLTKPSKGKKRKAEGSSS
mmetsp:Transcript_26388/g.36796  ORF Transcript_26388/g.36796 Transcript_26388/m.36796 type:complete len:176 (-) Transcript_26388:841-1368(-)